MYSNGVIVQRSGRQLSAFSRERQKGNDWGRGLYGL